MIVTLSHQQKKLSVISKVIPVDGSKIERMILIGLEHMARLLHLILVQQMVTH